MRDNRAQRPHPPTLSRRARVLRALARLTLTLFLLGGTGLLWYTRRPQPKPTPTLPLYRGIDYRRVVRQSPRALVVHILTIDLRAPGLEFLVTPGDPKADRPLRGSATSAFLREHGVQVAINGDFFYPWRSNHPLDYYPHVGDPVSVEGDAVSRGVRYAARNPGRGLSTLYFTRDNHVSIDAKPRAVFNAIGGHRLPLDRKAKPGDGSGVRHPRTAVGLSADRNTMYVVLVDGRQPNYSEGVTISELADLFRSLGATSAINLDGGGSTALVVANKKGKPVVRNSPIDHRIPGRERVVANHLGIYARPLPD